ncbi:hypothetical protein D3C71_1786770 [compost metagenome]
MNALEQIVGRIDRHEVRRSNREDMLCDSFSDWNGKAAADHVAQNIIDHIVEIQLFEHFLLLQKRNGRNNPSARAADAWSGAPCFHAVDAVESLENDLMGFNNLLIP